MKVRVIELPKHHGKVSCLVPGKEYGVAKIVQEPHFKGYYRVYVIGNGGVEVVAHGQYLWPNGQKFVNANVPDCDACFRIYGGCAEFRLWKFCPLGKKPTFEVK